MEGGAGGRRREQPKPPRDRGSLPLLAEGLEYLGLEQTPALYAVVRSPKPPLANLKLRHWHERRQPTTPRNLLASAEEEDVEPRRRGGCLPSPGERRSERRSALARQRDREVKAILRQLIDELIAAYASDDRGVEIREIAGGYRMATKPECHDAVRMFVKSLKPAMKLSLPALETLAVIAYKQPVTAPEVNEIRGVDSSGVLRLAAGAQADRHGGPQAGDRAADSLQDDPGVSAAVWPQGRFRAAVDGRVREDGGASNWTRRSGASG